MVGSGVEDMPSVDNSISQDERDRRRGRADRELDELQKSLALVDVELRKLADGLLNLVKLVNARAGRAAQHPGAQTPLVVPLEVSKYLDPSKLDALLQEQDELLKKIRSVHKETTC